MHDVCRILLVDDHKLLMEGIRSLLAPHSHLRVAGMAPDGKEAVGLAATLSPDLVIMDISMPGMNGVEASRAILQIRPETRILIYTGHEDQRHLLELIQLGIMGHVCKSDPPSVLLQAIDAVRQGEVFLSCADPGGCMAALRRSRAGAYTLDQALPLQLLLDRAQAGEDVSSLLLPVDSMFESSPPVRLTPRQERACRCGAAFSVALAPGTYRLYGASEFLALGRCDGTRMQTIKSFFEVN